MPTLLIEHCFIKSPICLAEPRLDEKIGRGNLELNVAKNKGFMIQWARINAGLFVFFVFTIHAYCYCP